MCVNELRDILQKLHSNEYSQVVHDILGNHCQDYDMVCKDRRLIFIDIVTRIGDVTSQSLLLQHVLSRQPPVNEELRRIFIHCAALENPIPVSYFSVIFSTKFCREKYLTKNINLELG